MHRTDNTRFLLFIEPPASEKLVVPVNDESTRIMKFALSEAQTGTSNYSFLDEEPRFRQGPGYKGYHVTECGTRSIGVDDLLENGMITNDLATFYLQYYRNSIPQSEMNKMAELVSYYKRKYKDKPEILEKEIPDHRDKGFLTLINEWFDEEEE